MREDKKEQIYGFLQVGLRETFNLYRNAPDNYPRFLIGFKYAHFSLSVKEKKGRASPYALVGLHDLLPRCGTAGQIINEFLCKLVGSFSVIKK